MRIKFNKGTTPEMAGWFFEKIVEERGNTIGSINIYWQEYDENMKMIKFDHDDNGYIEFVPGPTILAEHKEQEVEVRRSRMKIV